MTRASSDSMDAILGQEFPVLDHGFVRVVDYMGNDEAITQAARVSYGTGTKTVNKDRGLIRYLMRRWHTTPFEMCEIKLHVKLPIFVARQWIRHRTANVNEYSARYSILDREFYIPDEGQMKLQSQTNNQGRGELLAGDLPAIMRQEIEDHSSKSYDLYEDQTDGGLARELARMTLPANIYTQWYWKVDLHNLFHFLMLRADPHAQYEIREYARLILEIVADWVPYAYEAFVDYRLDSAQFSRMEMDLIRHIVGDDPMGDLERVYGTKFITDRDLSEREIAEFKQKLGVNK